jgi:hypothetical protein
VPPDSVRCTRELDAQLFTFRNFQRSSAIIHRTIRCTTGQCPVPQGRATLNSPASGIHSAIIHRTVRCDSKATATSRATVDCNALNARLGTQRSGAHAGGTPDILQGPSGAPPDSPEAPQVRAPTVEPQRSANVAGAPDSVRWRTGLSDAPCDYSPPTAIFGGWGYKYPNHPTFNGIQVFTLLHLTRASIQYKTHQSDQILSQLHTKL